MKKTADQSPETVEAAEVKKAEPRFPKAKILKAKRFSATQDILAALLKDDQEYTLAEAEKTIETWMKGTVK